MRQPHVEDQVSSILIIQHPVLCSGMRWDHLASRMPGPPRKSSRISMNIPFQGNKPNTAISVEQIAVTSTSDIRRTLAVTHT